MGNKYNGNLQTGRGENHWFASGCNIASPIAIGLIITFAALCTLNPAGSYAAETQQVPIRGAKDSTEQFSGTIYGPIDDNDTLWGIANRYRQNKNLSIYQVMVAIQELNPEAFSSSNLNDMKNGATLRLPSERYVARVDPQQAKLKADSDDDNWRVKAQAGTSLTNIKPPEKLASRSDLDSTKQQIESKLNRIDTEQQRQFEAIREQFKSSIDSVQTLLDENRKIYNRLDDVNLEIEELRDRIGDDGEVQRQMDQILALQNELVDNVRRQNALAASETDFAGALTSPIALILYSILLTSSLLVGLGMWLLKRQRQQVDQPDEQLRTDRDGAAATDLADVDTPVAEELAGEELTDADKLFDDDELSDEDIDHSLDEVLEHELDALDQIDEEMLATDSDDLEILGDDIDQVFSDEGTGAAVNPDIPALQQTPTADPNADPDTDLLNFTEELAEPEEDSESPEQTQAATEQVPADTAELTSATAPETSVDLPEEALALDESAQPEQPDDLIESEESKEPEQLVADEESVPSKEELEKVNEKLVAQNQELNDLTQELSNELRSAPDKEPGDPEIAIEGAADETFGDEADAGVEDATGNQVVDDTGEGLGSETEAEDAVADQDAVADEKAEVTDPGLDALAQTAAELQASTASPVADQPYADNPADKTPELVQAEPAPVAAETAVTSVATVEEDADFEGSAQDALADDLLAEFGIEPDAAMSAAPEPDSAQTDLADELLSEFGIEPSDTSVLEVPNASQQEDLADELLADLGTDHPELTQLTDPAGNESSAQESLVSDDAVDTTATDPDLEDANPISAAPAAEEMDADPAQEDKPRKHYPIDDLSEEDYQALLSELDDVPLPVDPDGQLNPTQLQAPQSGDVPAPNTDSAGANTAEEPLTNAGDADPQAAEIAGESAAVSQEADQPSSPPPQQSNMGEQTSGQIEAESSDDVSMLANDLNDLPEFGDWLLDSAEITSETSDTGSNPEVDMTSKRVDLAAAPSQEKASIQPPKVENTADVQDQLANDLEQQPATSAATPANPNTESSQLAAAELPALDDLKLSLDYFTADDETAKAVEEDQRQDPPAMPATAEHDDLSNLAEMLSEPPVTPGVSPAVATAAELSDALADPLGEVTATDDLLQHIENSTFEELLNSIDDEGEDQQQGTVAEQQPSGLSQQNSEPDYEAELAASVGDFPDDTQEAVAEKIDTAEDAMPFADAQGSAAQRPQGEAAAIADGTDNIDIAALLRDEPDDVTTIAAAGDTDQRPDFTQDEAATETFLSDDIDDSEPLTESEDVILPDNPDLDLDALLSDEPSMDDLDISDEELLTPDTAVAAIDADEEFTDVDTLLAESLKAEGEERQERDLNLESVLGDVATVGTDLERVDVDADGDMSAKLNLARAYLEISENDLAQQLLREVLDSGTTAERAEARDLLIELRGGI